MYGVYDFTDREGHWKGRRLDELLAVRVMKIAMADARDRYEAASPMSVATDAAPPFLLVQGTSDTLVPPVEARVFAEVLRGVSRQPVTLLEVPHAQHAFDLLASLRTRAVLQHVVAFCEATAGSAGEAAVASAGAAERLAVVAGGDAEAAADVQSEVGG
jgi:acetyl esterase/lipase